MHREWWVKYRNISWFQLRALQEMQHATCHGVLSTCYMPRACCLLTSLSTQSNLKKSLNYLDLNIKQTCNFKSSSRFLHLGKKWNANTHPVNSRDISSKANSVSLVNSWLFFLPFEETPNPLILCCNHRQCFWAESHCLAGTLTSMHGYKHTCSQAQSLSVHANLHWDNKI